MPKYLQPANRRGGSISQRLLAKTWQFPSLFPEGPHFSSDLLKVKGAVKIFFDAQRLFSYFCSFQPYHFLPDSNWCDSPFKSIIIFLTSSGVTGMSDFEEQSQELSQYVRQWVCPWDEFLQ
jgi:hypothetical protein